MGTKRSGIDWSDLRQLWGSKDHSIERIARAKGVSRTTVKRVAKELGLPSRTSVMHNPKAQQRHADPTPEEIAERCAALRERRPVGSREGQRWELPRFSYNHTTMTFRPI